jgi:hypothetical protein
MANFAKVNSSTNIVENVVTIPNAVTIDAEGNESEQRGIDYAIQLFGEEEGKIWVQTSETGSQRKRFARVGFTWDAGRNAFLFPQPHPSWTLNETSLEWEPPIAYPDFTDDVESMIQYLIDDRLPTISTYKAEIVLDEIGLSINYDADPKVWVYPEGFDSEYLNS